MTTSLLRHANGPLPAFLMLVGTGLFALSLPPVTDHAYQFYLAGRVLDGARLYVDVGAADMHPPLFTWLAMALERVGRAMDMQGLSLFPLTIVLTVAAALYAVSRIERQSGFAWVALVLILLPLAGPHAGQGEHIAVVLSLPYLFSAARAAAHGNALHPAARVAFAVAAGVGLGLKPYFALIWICVEGYIAVHRGARSLIRIESISVGAVFVVYVVATAFLTPEFFRLLPWLMELYPRFAAAPLKTLLVDWRGLLMLTALTAGWLLRRDPERAHLAAVLTLAMLGMYAAMLLQTKGLGYHWYPVNALAVLLCALWAERIVPRLAVLAPVIATAGILLMNLQVDRTFRLLASPPAFLPELLRLGDEHAPGRPIVAFSQYIQVGFPLVNLTRAEWGSPYGHLWMIPAIYRESWYGSAPVHYRRAGRWNVLEQQIFDRLWRSLDHSDPAFVIVDREYGNGFDMRSYLETDVRFRSFFQDATVLDTLPLFVVYGRRGTAAGLSRMHPEADVR